MTHPHYASMNSVPGLNGLLAAFPSLKTILFDMDGTLFDTEKYHTMALQQIGQDYKIIPPLGAEELHQLLLGKADHLLFELINEWPGFPKEWNVDNFVEEKNRRLLKILSELNGKSYVSSDIEILLKDAKLANIQLGLVTSSEKVITTEILKISGLAHYFSYVLTRDDSLRVKPDPWPYVKAVCELNAKTETTLVFEDSNVGVESALAAGITVIKAQWY